jgi:hypothetical protein
MLRGNTIKCPLNQSPTLVLERACPDPGLVRVSRAFDFNYKKDGTNPLAENYKNVDSAPLGFQNFTNRIATQSKQRSSLRWRVRGF